MKSITVSRKQMIRKNSITDNSITAYTFQLLPKQFHLNSNFIQFS